MKAAIAMVAAFLLFSCRAASYESEGDEYMRASPPRFAEALAAYRMAEASGGRGDKTLMAKIRRAYIDSQIDVGRSMLFMGDLEGSFDLFERLASEVPDHPTVQQWLRKARENYSHRLTTDGKERMGVRDYDAAIKLFERALQYNPTNTDARETLERARTIVKWRAEKGELMWKGGMRAISEGQTEVAESKLSSVENYTDAHPEAGEYVAEVRTLVGDRHFSLATSLEKDGQFFAAKQQYTRARNLKATPAGIDEAIARVSEEVKADQYYHAGIGALNRGDFDLAKARLDKALATTKRPENKTAIEARLAEVEEKRSEAEYKEATDMELEGRFADAIEALKKLDARVPAYRDTREKIDRLSRQTRDAEKNYQEAVAKFEAGDLAGARAKLKAALFLQPFMPQARKMLKEVEAALAAQAKPASK
jgi:tetratricopeptide (TPR) repeat protein